MVNLRASNCTPELIPINPIIEMSLPNTPKVVPSRSAHRARRHRGGCA
jgi:hypothetical protein